MGSKRFTERHLDSVQEDERGEAIDIIIIKSPDLSDLSTVFRLAPPVFARTI
jgi:hypothetical protein